jgi:hypothetical protein
MKVNEKWLEAHPGENQPPVMGGNGSSEGGGIDPNPIKLRPSAPAGPAPLDLELDAFKKLLGQLNPRFLGVSDELAGIAGGEDPRFDAFRQMQLGDVSARNAEFFGRRGTGGSTAALNALQRSTTGVNTQIGMAQLGRQDTARLQSLDVLRGFLENETVPMQLILQQLAAQNAATAADMAGQDDPFLKLGPISIG